MNLGPGKCDSSFSRHVTEGGRRSFVPSVATFRQIRPKRGHISSRVRLSSRTLWAAARRARVRAARENARLAQDDPLEPTKQRVYKRPSLRCGLLVAGRMGDEMAQWPAACGLRGAGVGRCSSRRAALAPHRVRVLMSPLLRKRHPFPTRCWECDRSPGHVKAGERGGLSLG